MIDALLNGVALNNQGLTDTNAVSGLGLVTFGNIWECKTFWFDNAYSNGGQVGVSTTWAAVGASISTSWTLCGASISTSWTLVTNYNSCSGE